MLPLKLKSYKATYVHNFLIIAEWEFHPTPEDPADYEIVILRGESPKIENMAAVSSSLGAQLFFYDSLKHPRASYFKDYYYRVRISGPSNTRHSKPFKVARPKDLVAAELMRKNEMLHRVKNGTKCLVYQKKKEGVRCAYCWDEVRHRVLLDQCPECLGTGYKRGFYSPVEMWINISRDQYVLQKESMGNYERRSSLLKMTAVPELKPEDLIFEIEEGVIWKIIENREKIKKQRSLYRQTLVGVALDKDSEEYQSIPGSPVFS